ncbi:MAG: metal-sensing transcriptional repressor [Rickettsiales bacterium]|jgi:DNA-binding FrmR family transcriptional regulator|nr:metal-sensing transcriptional repressor [Rickettsiales bacterium]
MCKNVKDMGKIDTDSIIKRLKRIEGQVRAIIRMVESDKPCEEILILISAAKSALHKVGQVVLEGHLRHCVVDGIKNGEEEKTINKLLSALEQFSRIN